ncbi:MAG TPA: carbon-nitrogen hydrolase family protein [Thermoguttaceae bacterium]|nr:carbon-nitrogen hydrolase family protein [Thermoguttaceae bacterium]
MRWALMHRLTIVCLFWLGTVPGADDLLRESFDGPPRNEPLVNTWGDKPAKVVTNATVADVGLDGGAAACLRLEFPDEVPHNLSYWQYRLAEPVPLVPELESVSFQVKTNVPVSIKIAISPYGFIYHGPGVAPADAWQKVALPNAYAELKKWCEGGNRTAEGGWLSGVIVAVGGTRAKKAEVLVDDVVVEGPTGAAQAAADEAFRRRIQKVRIVPISLLWDQGNRTLDKVLQGLDEAGLAGADLACLPECCVDGPAEPIPGPTAEAIAKKAAQHTMYVVGNLREQDGDKTYVTSFLCDRQGRIVGKYRKSHRLPYEAGPGPGTGFALGDELPVFETDFGPLGMKIGTDHYFPEIDTVLRRRGARLVVWSTSPFPVRDEHTITLAIQGRAVDNRLYYAVARYAGKEGYGGYPNQFSWTATWPLGRAQVFDPDGHTLADSGHEGGVAVATIPASRLTGSLDRGGYDTEGKYALITAAELPAPFARTPETKRVVRAAAIECDTDFERLIEKLDHCGRQGCDIACLWEYVWYQTDEEVEKFKERNGERLAQLAEAAKRNKMYVVIGGELERGFNESILFDRQGNEMGRYTKIIQTTAKTSKYYRAGEKVGVYDLDFGRICTKICADVYAHEIDLVARLHQVDLLLHHTQDAGPFTEHTRLRDHHRAVDCGYFLLRATSQTGQTDHRAYVMDPWGMILAASQFRTGNEPVIVTLQLDNRPPYYEWPEEIRQRGPYPDPYKSGKRPVAQGDLRAVLLAARRPELYKPLPEPEEK